MTPRSITTSGGAIGFYFPCCPAGKAPRGCRSRNIPLSAPSRPVAVPPRVHRDCVCLTRSLPITYDSKGWTFVASSHLKL